MKKLIAVVALSLVGAGVALAGTTSSHKVTDAEVQAAIDARLHEMLHDLNAQHALAARR